MVVFSWIMFVLAALLLLGSIASLLVFLLFDLNVWLDRARSLRRGLYMALLLWFNVWVWGRVIMVLIHW